MIIKKLARKTSSFKNLMDYINKDKVAPPILYNLLSQTKSDILKEFEANAYLVKKRKNANYLYHEILSFHPKDAEKLKYRMLEDLTLKYLETRTEGKGLAYAAVHWGKNPHVHVMLSANRLGKSKKLNLSNKQFKELKRDIEVYQREKYPCLSHSLVFEKKLQRKKIGRKEGERNRRLEKEGKKTPSEKQKVYELVQTALETATSEKEFKEKLKAGGLEFYQRGKKTFGVQKLDSNGKYKKFRFKTLGLLELWEKMFDRWRRLPERERIVKNIEIEKGQNFVRELGYGEYVLRVLSSEKDLGNRMRGSIECLIKGKKNER